MSHFEHLSHHVRKEEEREVKSLNDETMLQALLRSFNESDASFTAIDKNGTPIASFGFVYDNESGFMNAWLLGSDSVPNQRISFMKSCKHYLPIIMKHYPNLRCFIDSRYTQSVNWIKKMGFSDSGKSLISPDGTKFIEFHRYLD